MGDAARAGIDRGTALLRRRQMPAAARVLEGAGLTAAARSTLEPLADSWLATVAYERSAQQRIAAARWLTG